MNGDSTCKLPRSHCGAGSGTYAMGAGFYRVLAS